MTQTTNQIIDLINPAEVLVKLSNYIQWIDSNNKLREAQYCYKVKKWYEFETYGNALTPQEKFIKYLN